jgi:hypothetical protein
MNPKPGTRETFSQDSTEPSTPGDAAKPTISFADFSRLWRSEVPKVIQAHEEHRQEVRRSLGLA